MTHFALNNLNYDEDNLKNIYENMAWPGTWKQYGETAFNSVYVAKVQAEQISDVLSNFRSDVVDTNNIIFQKMLAGGGAAAHTDERNVAILIPVIYDSKHYMNIHTDTIFEGYNDELGIKLYTGNILDTISVTYPYILNTKIPYSYSVDSPLNSICLSLGVNDEYNDFEKIKGMYENNELLV